MPEKKGYNRRDFLKILGASTGVAASGCAQELPEKLLPYVVQPDEIIPGVAAWYAGTCNECDAHCGTLVRTRGGRVTKVEGNPLHPLSRGGLCSRGQSSDQGLYNPDRVREPLLRAVKGSFKPVDWKTAADDIAEKLSTASKAGKEIAILTPQLGPSEFSLLQQFRKAMPGITHYQYNLLEDDALDAATTTLFGSPQTVQFEFSNADVVFGVGAGYLETWHAPVPQTKGFAAKRRPSTRKGKGKQNTAASVSTVYHVEPRLSLTAANADTWLKNVPGSEHAVLQALLLELLSGDYQVSATAKAQLNSVKPAGTPEALLQGSGVEYAHIKQAAAALADAEGALVLAGGTTIVGEQAKLCAELAVALNYLLGSIGTTVKVFPNQSKADFNGYRGLLELKQRLDAGSVAAVLLVDSNPVYASPASLNFDAALGKASLVVSLNTQLDETAILAHYVLPGLTNFERWNDSRPVPGVHGLNQPAMQPLYEGQDFGNLLVAISNAAKIELGVGEITSFYDYLRGRWREVLGETDFEQRWLAAVERGGYWEKSRAQGTAVPQFADSLGKKYPYAEGKGLELLTFASVHLGDGAAANRPWAQEVPDPITTTVWGSWIELHPATAKAAGLKHGQVARVRSKHGSIEAPVYVSRYISEKAVGVPLGQGHVALGRFAAGIGVNPLVLMPSSGERLFELVPVSLERSIAREELVKTQGHDFQLDRGLIRTVSVSALGATHGEGQGRHHDDHGHDGHGHDGHGAEKAGAAAYGLKSFHHHDPHALGPQKDLPQMYEQMEHVAYNWGLAVDLASCTGCSACVTACYAENNVPVVGKDLCAQGREMSWIRIERYFDEENETSPVTGFMPMMCQHCNNAPCEPVCPVYATYHSEDGLNTMVYNRCVGTRYCSNNCSYKVRRFNWFNYEWQSPLNWQLNPDVTVRSVGVMEKCTFCIQRIREGQHKAKDLGRPVKDGDISPACASSCPADAIVFGNLNDDSSQVYKQSQDERSYRVLQVEINTQPSVYYLAEVTHEEGKDSSHS